MAKDKNDVRDLLYKMRNQESSTIQKPKLIENKKKVISMRDMLKITRKLNEESISNMELDSEEPISKTKRINKATAFDKDREERKFRNFFSDMTVTITFIELEVNDDIVSWGGTIDGMIQFMYTVTADEATSGTDFNYLEGFSPQNAGNEEIIKKIESYYDIFYKYWRDNFIEK